MKCTNCGMNNATCHYRYNINGKVTEAHLCPDCAAKMEGKIDGFDFNEAFDSFDRIFDDMWSGFFTRPLFGSFGFGVPALMTAPAREKKETAEAKTEEKKTEGLDPELSKRREINALREELNTAVKEENFEKAIELRDKLRELQK